MFKKPTVYLAGPIAGLTEGEAKDWRTYASSRLQEAGIIGVSPLRCEPSINGRYDVPDNGQELDTRFGTALAIGSKNDFDARHCTMTLAYLPKSPRRSVGTIIEIGWGRALNKPVIVVTDDEYLQNHPCIIKCASWILDELDQGLDVAVGLLEVYGSD